MLKVITVTPENVDTVMSIKLREADIRELLTASGCDTPEAALRRAIQNSKEWTEAVIDDNGECIAIFGLSSYQGMGIPWMVGSDEVANHKMFLFAHTAKTVARMLARFQMIHNFIDSRNKMHIRWLKRMGFKFPGYGRYIDGVWFHYFFKER